MNVPLKLMAVPQMWQIAKKDCHLARACALHWNGLNLWRANETSTSLNRMKSTELNATHVDQRNMALVFC
jgi:hypothetical protein